MTGEIAGLATALLWAWTATFFTIAGRHVGSFTVNVYRIPLGLLFLSLTHVLTGGGFSVTSYQFIFLFFSGVIGLAIGDAFLFEAFVLIGPRMTLLVFTTSPAMTAVIAFLFLNERIGWLKLLGMAVTLFAVVWVILEKRRGKRVLHARGLMYALMGSLGQAVGLVLAKSALNTGIEPLYATVLRMFGAAIGLILFLVLIRRPTGPATLWKKRAALLPLLGGVICGPFLGVWLSQVAIDLTQTGIAATLMATTPILIIPISHFVEKEKITIRAVVGAAAAIAGVALLF